jgi:inner membrane protein
MNISGILWSTEFWLVIGVVLLIVEVLSVSFFCIFLASGALVTALAVKLGFANALWVQLSLFSVVSVLSTIAFREMAIQFFHKKGSKDAYNGDFIGERALITKEIVRNGIGRVSYRGAEWQAESKHNNAIGVGTQVVIKEVNGMVLLVE